MNSLKSVLSASFLLVVLLCMSAGVLAADTSPPASPVKLVFIHHSTGGNWLADSNPDGIYGELGKALMNNNYYVSATNYGWGPDGIGDNTDIIHWPDWFTGADSSAVLSRLYAETGQNIQEYGAWSRLSSDPGGENVIVMFKSCFPNSDLFGDPDDAAAATVNDQYTVANAKAVYNNILTYFASRRDKLFVVITAPPQNEGEYAADYQTPGQRAANARAFNNWLVNDWRDGYAYHNVAVFDYYNVLTAADNHHRITSGNVEHVINTAYNFAGYPSDDSHPNTEGQQKATTEFVPLLNHFYNRWVASGDSDADSGTSDDGSADDDGTADGGGTADDDGGTADDGATGDDAADAGGGGGSGGCFVGTVVWP